MITFTIPIVPVPKGRARVTQYGTFTPIKTRRFETEFKILAKQYAPKKLLIGPLKLEVYFYVKMPKRPKFFLPVGKPDGDNFFKAVMDSLEGIFFKNDSQICDGRFMKLYDTFKNGERICVEIYEMKAEAK